MNFPTVNSAAFSQLRHYFAAVISPERMIHYTRLAFVPKRGFVPQTASCTAANENHGARKILRKSLLREIQSANLCTRGVPLLIQRVVGRD